MGKLIYDGIDVEFDDRVLAHVQIVVAAKLRRGEGFFFSWHDASAIGDGRSSVWLHDSIPLYFKFFGSKSPEINRHWIDSLMLSANSGQPALTPKAIEGFPSSGRGEPSTRAHS
jgi:hypothetical protein